MRTATAVVSIEQGRGGTWSERRNHPVHAPRWRHDPPRVRARRGCRTCDVARADARRERSLLACRTARSPALLAAVHAPPDQPPTTHSAVSQSWTRIPPHLDANIKSLSSRSTWVYRITRPSRETPRPTETGFSISAILLVLPSAKLRKLIELFASACGYGMK